VVLFSNQQTSGLLQPFFWGGMERKSEKCHLPLGLIHRKWGTYDYFYLFGTPGSQIQEKYGHSECDLGKNGVVMI
jgi:hypothetical protein